MTDLLQATHDAIFAALDVAAVTDLAPVFTNVPPERQPPFIEVGAIEAKQIGGKDGGLEQHAIEIEFRHRGQSKRPLFAMMSAARAQIEGALLVAAGAAFGRPVWTDSATDREDDGVTHHGAMRFEVIVQQDS